MKKYYDAKGSELTQKEYLYGIDVDVTPIPNEYITRRLELLEEHLAELLDTHPLQREGARINAIISAKDFWSRLG